jgi:Dolichyl-phosphate-mannose-protein mannosyltransferase
MFRKEQLKSTPKTFIITRRRLNYNNKQRKKMSFSDTKPSITVALALFFLATLSRIYGIWEWDLIDDEYFTATLAHERFKSFINPAYYTLVVLTYELLGPEEWLSRLPAFLISIATFPIFYILCARTFGRNAALFAAIILLFCSWHLYFSQLARFYSGVFLFASIAYIYFYRALYSSELKHLIIALIASGVAVSFHATAIFVPFSTAIAYLTLLFFYRGNYEELSAKNMKLYLGLCLIGGLIVTPFLFNVLTHWVSTGQAWGYGSILIVPQIAKYIGFPIVIGAMFGVFFLFNKNKPASVFLTICCIIPCLFVITASPYMAISPSYTFYMLAPIIILAGLACDECHQIIKEKKQTALSYFPIVLLIVLLLPSFTSHYLAKKSLNFDNAEAFVASEITSGDKVLSFIPGFELDASPPYELLPFISFERDNSIDWIIELGKVVPSKQNLWILVSSKRKPIAQSLEKWLQCNAKLVWQKHATRLDYEVDGYQVYLSSKAIMGASKLKSCAPS